MGCGDRSFAVAGCFFFTHNVLQSVMCKKCGRYRWRLQLKETTAAVNDSIIICCKLQAERHDVHINSYTPWHKVKSEPSSSLNILTYLIVANFCWECTEKKLWNVFSIPWTLGSFFDLLCISLSGNLTHNKYPIKSASFDAYNALHYN